MPRFSSRAVLLVLAAAAAAAAGTAWWVYTRRPDYLLRRGRDALAEGRLDVAARLARRLSDRGLADHARLLWGEARVLEGRAARDEAQVAPPLDRARLEGRAREAYRLALDDLAQVRGDGPLADAGTLLGAECLVHLDHRWLAAEALETLTRRQPDNREAHRWLAAIYIDLNSPNEAVSHLREWGRLDPANGRPYRWVGFFCKNYNRAEEAVEAYREALRRDLDPALRAEVVKELVEVLAVALSDFQAALQVLDGCDEPLRSDPDLRALRAECAWGLGDAAETARLADAALHARPDHPRALLLRARAHLADGQTAPAVALLEKAVRLAPHDHGCRQALMEACNQLGDKAKAEGQRRLLEQTREDKAQLTKLHTEAANAPWNDAVRYEIALLCRKLDRPAEARMWLQAALACNPGNLKARQALAELNAQEGRPAPGPASPR